MKLYKHLLSKLKNGQNVYLLTVVQNSGSSPGRQGFKMTVAQDGTIFGSIGGGVMEYKLAEKAKQLLQQNEITNSLTKQIHQAKTPHSSGMICSGEQTVVFSALSGKHIASIQKILQEKDNYNLRLTPNEILFCFDSNTKKNIFNYKSETDWFYQEPINNKKTVYIFGSGHVGLATAELLKFLDYNIVVFDNRKDLNTFNENVVADKKEIISYKNSNNYVPNTKDSIVIIMTNKYTDDKLILEKLLKNKTLNFGYIGV
jgi:xanthine dehydrogenase accessory factor